MKKILSYLKPYWKLILLAIALLFVQAMCDLSLPDYMSNIINVGIQQSGITESSPKVISEEGYTLMNLFMKEEDQKVMSENYERITKESENYSNYLKEYPILGNKNIYVRKENADIDAVGEAFKKAVVSMTNISNQMQKEKKSLEDTETSTSASINLAQIYSMIPMLNSIPKEQLEPYFVSTKEANNSLLSQTSTLFIKAFYDELKVDTSKIQRNYIKKIGIQMLGLALLIAFTSVLIGFLSARVGTGFARDVRRKVFEKVESFSTVEMKKFQTSSLITRTTNDITQVQMLIVMGLRMMCYAPIMGAGGIIMALRKSASMSWIIALAVIVLIGLIAIIFSIAMPKFKIMQTLIDKLNLVARENLNGLLVIRAFGTQKFEEKRFDNANKDLANTNLFVQRVMNVMMPAMTLIMNGVVILIVWVGAHRIESSALQVGDMMAYIQYAMQIIMSFLMIAVMFIMVPRASVSARRISEVLETTPSIQDPENPKKFIKEMRGYVEFDNVNFRYDDAEEDVLHHISFVAEPGKTTAFIGSTGSGKSTLINLIPRFFDVTGGKILVNGVDVREVRKEDLCNVIGYIPQKGMLLSGTIDSNLRYGKQKATKKEIIEAAKVAQATEFINSKEEKYESAITQGGSNVSGGQKQRLSIARALVKKADVYIFDDSFSALDFKTDAKLRTALKEYTKGSTVLIVAQRISTIMNADQIIVLDKGEIVGIGTHKELLKNCKTYYEIASSQLSKEELM